MGEEATTMSETAGASGADTRPLHVLVQAGVDLPEPVLAGIRDAAGPDAVVRVLPEADTSPDRLSGIEVAFGNFPLDLLTTARSVRWIQVSSAGVEDFLTEAVRRSGITLTNARGVYGVAGAEHVLGEMLLFTRRLQEMRTAQRERRWEQATYLTIPTLQGQTLGVVGLGGIGSQIALRGKAFGMTVLAVRRHPAETPPYVDHLSGMDGLDDLLAAADHVALALPLTAETRNLIDATRLARLKPTAYLYNIGRGAVVDETALIAALQARRFAGAALDVFVEEPLPADSPLWDLPNVLITPHVGANGPADWIAVANLFADNLRRYRAGQPLRNVVDFDLGY
jgi:phosphoglycerate dehydrogenase-like enzyme